MPGGGRLLCPSLPPPSSVQVLRLEAMLGQRKVEDAYTASSELLKVREGEGRSGSEGGLELLKVREGGQERGWPPSCSRRAA